MKYLNLGIVTLWLPLAKTNASIAPFIPITDNNKRNESNALIDSILTHFYLYIISSTLLEYLNPKEMHSVEKYSKDLIK